MDQPRTSCPCCHTCYSGHNTLEGEPILVARFGPADACPDKENHQ